jgi:uncharacterized protein YkwD
MPPRPVHGGLLALAVSACAASLPLAPTTEPTAASAPVPEADASPGWAAVTQAPWPVEASAEPRAASLAAACGAEDGALTRVARELAALRARGLGAPDAELVAARLRAAGQPDVRPRLLSVTGQAPLDDARIRAALDARTRRGARTRCGAAIVPAPHGGELLVAVEVEALADLSPLPTRARTGQWLSFEARLHVAARRAEVVVLGPRGAPRTVPTSLDERTGVARARFVLDQPGAFTLQLIADLADEGPRPLLEARVFADVAPPAPGDEPSPAPGEAEGDDADALFAMVARLRALEGLAPITRDDSLDALARAHAEHMRERRATAHDLGDGDPRERFLSTGTLDARAVGENVAHARTVSLAHRALYASPSHRINLLRADYTYMGVAVARAEDGSVYVCEAFAAAARTTAPARR